MSDQTPQDPTFVLPPVPRKEGFDNAQYDNEAPHNLSGVMSRWVVPEGYTEEEPQLLMVPLLDVTSEDQEENESEEPQPTTTNSRVVFFLVFGMIFLLFGSLFLNFFFMVFKH